MKNSKNKITELNRHASSKQLSPFLLKTIKAMLVPLMVLAALLTQSGNLYAAANGAINTNLTERDQSLSSGFGVSPHEPPALINTRELNDNCAFFEATPVDQMVYLQWTTNTTCPAKWYIVEKSHNNKRFTKLLKIEASALRPESTEYLEIDRDLWRGISYYRFRIIDEHGNCTYSQLSVVVPSMEISTKDKPSASKPQNINKGRQEPIGMWDEDILIVVRNGDGVFTGATVRILSTDARQFIAVDMNGILDEGTYLIIASSDDRLKNKRVWIGREITKN